MNPRHPGAPQPIPRSMAEAFGRHASPLTIKPERRPPLWAVVVVVGYLAVVAVVAAVWGAV